MKKLEEKLADGGILMITEKDWYIEYQYQGPDDRYSQLPYRIYGKDMEAYKEAYVSNYNTYCLEKEAGTVQTICGDMGMNIRFGLYEGVCLYSHHKAIRTKKALDKQLHCFEYAQKRAAEEINRSNQ